MAFENIGGKILTDAEKARLAEKDFTAKRAKVVFAAQQGQLPFIATDGTNNVRYDFAIVQGDFCQTTQEIEDAKVRVVSFKDVFNTWRRFSHNNSPTPGLASELTNWSYDQATDTIKSTINSVTLIGLVSRTKYRDWEMEAYLSSKDGDDDTVGVVLAFATDADGIEHSLTALRSPGGSGFTWRVYANHRNERAGLTTQVAFGMTAVRYVKWGNGAYGSSPAEAGFVSNGATVGWDDMNRTKVYVKRAGDVITCKCSDFEAFDPTMTYIPESEIVVDLASTPSTKIFMDAAAYGFCAQSQHAATFNVIRFVGGERVIYDVKTGVVYTDNGSGWLVNVARKLTGDLGTGKMLFNRFTGKLFYVESEGEVYHLNSMPMA